MLDLYYLKPYHIVPSVDQWHLQQLSERIAQALGAPICVEIAIMYGDYFQITLYNFEDAKTVRIGDDFDAILADAIADFAAQIAATKRYWVT